MREEHSGFFSLSYPNLDLSLDGIWLLKMSSRVFELFSNFDLIDSSSNYFIRWIISSSSLSDSCILFLSCKSRSSSIFLAYWRWVFKSLMIWFGCLFFFLHFSSSSRALMSSTFRYTYPSSSDSPSWASFSIPMNRIYVSSPPLVFSSSLYSIV